MHERAARNRSSYVVRECRRNRANRCGEGDGNEHKQEGYAFGFIHLVHSNAKTQRRRATEQRIDWSVIPPSAVVTWSSKSDYHRLVPYYV